MDRLRPGTAVQALAWAAPIGGLAGDLAEAHRRAKLRALGDSYRGLVSHGVFGRDAELARLRAFAVQEVDPPGRSRCSRSSESAAPASPRCSPRSSCPTWTGWPMRTPPRRPSW